MRTYKIEIKPTIEQEKQILKTMGVCRFLYNLYIEQQIKYYKENNKFLSSNKFDQWYRKEYITEETKWIKEVSSKARVHSILDCEKAFKRFFKKQANFPKFKKRNKNHCSVYFCRPRLSYVIKYNRHNIKLPLLGWVRFKEFGYLPKNKTIISGRITKRANRYFVSLVVEEEEKTKKVQYSKGIGIDLGIKELMVVSNGKVYKNINKIKKVKRLEKQLKHQQRCLSRKYESNKKFKKGGKNIHKQILKVQKVQLRLDFLRSNYENQVVNDVLKNRPEYIVLEDLNVKGMLKNKHLSKSISNQRFYSLKTKLINKSKEYGIEVRIVDRYYPSSKTCSKCGRIKQDLKLKDRTYICTSCGNTIDRDLNAAINLANAKSYKVA